MRHINIIGVISLFLPLACRFHSKRALIIMINGILFHSNDKNSLLRRYDILCNMIFCIYSFKHNKLIGKHILFAFCNWVYNMYLLNNKYINEKTGDYYHVLGVQFPLSYALQNSLLLK
jgi:hypothetical protein